MISTRKQTLFAFLNPINPFFGVKKRQPKSTKEREKKVISKEKAPHII
jgi:hypothetical protein